MIRKPPKQQRQHKHKKSIGRNIIKATSQPSLYNLLQTQELDHVGGRLRPLHLNLQTQEIIPSPGDCQDNRQCGQHHHPSQENHIGCYQDAQR